MQDSAGAPWIWLCNIFLWTGRIITCPMAGQAVGDRYEIDYM